MFELVHSKPVAYFGRGAIVKMKDITGRIDGKLLIVTTKSAYKRSGAWDVIKSALEEKKVEYELYDKVRANPTYANCDDAASMGADWVMGIGGGAP